MIKMTDEELTEAVAERVMGWHQDYGSNPGTPPIWLTSKNEVTGFYVSCKSVYKTGWKKKIRYLMWQPLTDMNHAWMVVERMRELGFLPDLTHNRKSWWVRFIDNDGSATWCHGSSVSRAACEAALEAVGGIHE